MGAHWHLMLPLEIGLEYEESRLEEKDIILPVDITEMFSDFEKELTEEDSYYLGKRKMVSLTRKLKDEHLSTIMPFVNLAWSKFQHESDAMKKNRQVFWSEHLKDVVMEQAQMFDLADTLRNISENYYIRTEGVSDMVVYAGWPKWLQCKGSRSFIYGLVISTSVFKMGEDPEDGVAFENCRRFLKEELGKDHPVAGLLQVLGY
jgi:hypothetical protein